MGRIGCATFFVSRSDESLPVWILRGPAAGVTVSGGILEHAMSDLNYSARAHDRILKVARTLADLAGIERITGDQVLEAVNYRTLDRSLRA